jgi:hypothetical protein
MAKASNQSVGRQGANVPVVEAFPESRNSVRWVLIESGNFAIRVSWGEHPQAEERDHRAHWRACLPEERLIYPVLDEEAKGRLGEDARKRYDVYAAFHQLVPDQIALAVEGFRSHQWNLLVLTNALSKARDLVRSNPVLAYALANNHEFRLKPDHTALPLARFHCRRRQREILSWLGFPESETLVRAFRKIEPSAVTPHRLRMLRNALHRYPKVLKLLSHMERITPPVFDLLLDGALVALVTPTLLSELSQPEQADLGSLADRLMHALSLQQEMGLPLRKNPFNSVRKANAFVETVDRDYMVFEERVQREEAERLARQADAQRRAEEQRKHLDKIRLSGKNWPRPPIAGTPLIRPVVSHAGLKQEAKQQKNCVAIYWRQVVLGDAYIYSVRLPNERATLAIRHIMGDSWRISELGGKGNKPASAALRTLVDRWMYEHELLKGSV